VLSGADDFDKMQNYGKQQEAFLRRFLDLPNGMPSHDTINRVFTHMDKNKFADCLHQWSKELLDFMDYYQVNIDGKMLRATGQAGKNIQVSRECLGTKSKTGTSPEKSRGEE
jgi:N6-adenosine-specific RNA methylase IME4